MTQAAIEMFSTFGVAILCIVLGIIVLSLFFTFMSRTNQTGAHPDTLAIRGILKKDTWATVHTTAGQTYEAVRLIGFTNNENFKTSLPYELEGMVILEDAKQRRFLIRAKAIRMIEIAPDQNNS